MLNQKIQKITNTSEGTVLTSKSLELVLVISFSIVLLDSMITYFTRTIAGVFFPVSILLPFILSFIFLQWGKKIFDIPNIYIIALILGEISVFIGFVLNSELTLTKIGAPILAACAYIISYATFRWVKNESYIINAIILVCGSYAAVCLIALLGLYPSLFPVINAEWANNGVIELRPEVTTDQNFQVFYLLPIISMLAIRQNIWKYMTILLIILVGIVVLIKLQTRSGVLVYSALIGMVWVAPLWVTNLSKTKLLFLPIIVVGVLIFYIDALINISSLLLARFGEAGALGAAQGRLESITYFFEKVWNPFWWLPGGYDDYMSNHRGDIPHSNITAIFIEGGLLGFYMWVMLFLVPGLTLLSYFLKKKLSGVPAAVLLTGLAFLIIQLTLNVPFFKQPWLWAGATLGVLIRLRNEPLKIAAAIEVDNVSEAVDKYPVLHKKSQRGLK